MCPWDCPKFPNWAKNWDFTFDLPSRALTLRPQQSFQNFRALDKLSAQQINFRVIEILPALGEVIGSQADNQQRRKLLCVYFKMREL